MIYKHIKYKNGYVLANNASDEEFQKICSLYKEIKCIICNKETSKAFSIYDGYSRITINNKLNNGCFFINCIK